MEPLEHLKQTVLDNDNTACFIEREEILRSHAQESLQLPPQDRYTHELCLLLDNLSTPIDDDDLFAGRMLEAPWPHPEPFSRIPYGITSDGHITLPTQKLLTTGLAGILADIRKNARRIGTSEARYFLDKADSAFQAIRRFCARYADAAESAGKTEMARALRVVPFFPAYDFFSALQSVWMFHFIMGTICGARDFAPGRLDQALMPFYLREPDDDKIRNMLAFFCMKFNEITGTNTDNYKRKPTPTQASKQYITLGGTNMDGTWQFNRLSELFIEAAAIIKLPQPTFNFRIAPGMPADAWRLVGKAAHLIDAQCNFFNEDVILNTLLNHGIEPQDAHQYTFTACNRVDLPGKLHNIMPRIDRFDDSFNWFHQALFQAEHTDGLTAVDAILEKLSEIARNAIDLDMKNSLTDIFCKECLHFRVEDTFLDQCVQSCTDIHHNGCNKYRWNHRMFSGIANMADSLMTVKRLVDDEKRLTLPELRAILDDNFQGHDDLLDEIRHRMPKYGNGIAEVDALARRTGNVLIDAADAAALRNNFILMPSFYSLTHHHRYGSLRGATPDGRLDKEQISENQSPVHGMDTQGPTELLKSVASLPLRRCICGGLNVKFTSRMDAGQLSALVKTFFQLGGLHIGFTFASRETLEAARKSPQEYRTLLVRKTGFSEYYIYLSPTEQQEIIDRTQY